MVVALAPARTVCHHPSVSERPTLAELVTEDEHAALDLLDDAVDAADPELAQARLLARAAFERCTRAAGLTALEAAGELASLDSIDGELLETGRRTLEAHPELGPALAPAVELCATILGLDRDTPAWAVLLELAAEASERAEAQADTQALLACSDAIAEQAAALTGAADSGGLSPAQRVFRSALVVDGGLGLRARILAADHPQHLRLATALIEGEPDATPGQLVDAFEQAVRAQAKLIAEAGAKRGPVVPGGLDDAGESPGGGPGPRRKFSWTHLVLAAIVLGLTIWHYGFR